MNTRKLLVVGLLTMAVLLLSACTMVRGSGNLITETRDVSNFERVDLSGSGDVIITQGEEESLTVETDNNLMQHVTTNVRGRTLHLGMNIRQTGFASPTRLVFTLQVKDLTGLDLSGSGSIAAATLTTDRLDADLSGSGALAIDEIRADQLRLDLNGSSNVQVAGEVNSLNIDISGSSDVRAGDLRSDAVNVQISGSGATTVWAVEKLNVDLSGSGSVRYYGEPTLDSSTSGSGTVRGLGEK